MQVCVLDIDVQGVKQIKKTSFKPWYIFVEPPSLEELESRLRARNTESEESLNQRLTVAKEELLYGKLSYNIWAKKYILINLQANPRKLST